MRIPVTIDNGNITEVITQPGHARLVAAFPLDTTDTVFEIYYDEDTTWTLIERNEFSDTTFKLGVFDSMMEATIAAYRTLGWTVD